MAVDGPTLKHTLAVISRLSGFKKEYVKLRKKSWDKEEVLKVGVETEYKFVQNTLQPWVKLSNNDFLKVWFMLFRKHSGGS